MEGEENSLSSSLGAHCEAQTRNTKGRIIKGEGETTTMPALLAPRGQQRQSRGSSIRYTWSMDAPCRVSFLFRFIPSPPALFLPAARQKASIRGWRTRGCRDNGHSWEMARSSHAAYSVRGAPSARRLRRCVRESPARRGGAPCHTEEDLGCCGVFSARESRHRDLGKQAHPALMCPPSYFKGRGASLFRLLLGARQRPRRQRGSIEAT